MTARRPVVAIDGPAGAGKTTITQRVAERLGYLRVDTGALYRSVALAAQRRGVSIDDEAAASALARELASTGEIRFVSGADGRQRVRLGDDDVTDAIRTQAIGQGASRVSAWPGVRAALLDLQRVAGRDGGVVLEGRDIGTVVFPNAEAKFFLTASVTVRAERRLAELRSRGNSADLESIRAEVEERDRRDSGRSVAPLRQAEDAMLVDSSDLNIEEVVDRIVTHVQAVERSMAGGSAV